MALAPVRFFEGCKLPAAVNLIPCDIYLDERRRPFPPLPPPVELFSLFVCRC